MALLKSKKKSHKITESEKIVKHNLFQNVSTRSYQQTLSKKNGKLAILPKNNMCLAKVLD